MTEKIDGINEVSNDTESSKEKSEEVYKEIEALLKYTDKNIDSEGMIKIEEAAKEELEVDNHIIAAEQYLISLYSCTSEKSDVKVDENGLIA